jgi:hypothetical protein
MLDYGILHSFDFATVLLSIAFMGFKYSNASPAVQEGSF